MKPVAGYAPYAVIALLLTVLAMPARSQQEAADPVFEVRSYHIDPDRLDEYRTWVEQHGLPYLREHLDVVGFWIGQDEPSEITGPPLDELGSANVTWIIEWPSKAARDTGMAGVFSTEEWGEIFARLPAGRDTYLRIEARFLEAL